ncbi:MAG: galactose mutarotase [Planctomycetes bacterium]|jgi:aldose 1-epimerase|nr:galactose mutarotase [Planctomycetota bacterium]
MKLALAAALSLTACSSMADQPYLSVSSRWFGTQQDGRTAMLWTLRVPGLEIDVCDLGATLVAVRTPDRAGFPADIVLGFEDVKGYQSPDNQYFGCTTGRVCNRIAGAEFTLDGYTYVLAKNNGPNHLHGGGPRSFDKVHWDGEVLDEGGAPGVRFSYLSRDGEEGYPGNLEVQVTYQLLATTPPQLSIRYQATTDKRTPINLTNHAYWNLGGHGSHTVLDHVLQVEADQFTATDATLIPTGKLVDVVGTPLDFTSPQPIGLRIDQLQETPAQGYDHNYVLRGSGMKPAAKLVHKASGRTLRIATTEPGLQVYSGNFLHGQTGKQGKSYARRSAVCLETQHFPDSVHQPLFPSTLLAPGETFRSETVLTFGVDD